MPSSTESQGVSKLDLNLLRSRKPVEIVKLGIAGFPGEEAGA